MKKISPRKLTALLSLVVPAVLVSAPLVSIAATTPACNGALDMRDPKVLVDNNGQLMVTGTALDTGGYVAGPTIFTSSDGSSWTRQAQTMFNYKQWIANSTLRGSDMFMVGFAGTGPYLFKRASNGNFAPASTDGSVFPLIHEAQPSTYYSNETDLLARTDGTFFSATRVTYVSQSGNPNKYYVVTGKDTSSGITLTQQEVDGWNGQSPKLLEVTVGGKTVDLIATREFLTANNPYLESTLLGQITADGVNAPVYRELLQVSSNTSTYDNGYAGLYWDGTYLWMSHYEGTFQGDYTYYPTTVYVSKIALSWNGSTLTAQLLSKTPVWVGANQPAGSQFGGFTSITKFNGYFWLTFRNGPAHTAFANGTCSPGPGMITLYKSADGTNWQHVIDFTSTVSDIVATATSSAPYNSQTDSSAPTVPSNVSATAVSSSQINLSWSASTDNVGVTGYTIYRGGTKVGTSAINSYSDTNLTANTTYSYTISAYDAAGNVSAQSTSVSAATQGLPVTALTVSPISIPSGGSVTVTWSGVASPTTTDWVGVYVPGSGSYISWIYSSSCTTTAGSAGKASGSCSFTMPTTAGPYELRLYANNSSTLLATSNQVTVTTGSSDTTAPSTPTGLTATAISSSQINLTWTASTDNVGVTGYNIYRDGVLVGTSATNSYSDTGLTASTQYSYTVSSYDGAGNTSAQSNSANATTQIALSTPSLSASPVSVSSGGAVTVSWSGIALAAANDWIGVYVPGSGSYLNWLYTSSCTKTAGSAVKASGSCSITMPATAGTYELRLYTIGSSLIAKSNTVTVTAPPPFGKNIRVMTTASTNVRSKAGIGGRNKVLCTQPTGALGTIIDGPTNANGYTWWKVNYDTSCDGWSVQDYLTTALADAGSASTLATAGAGATNAQDSQSVLVALLQQLQYAYDQLLALQGTLTTTAPESQMASAASMLNAH